jgi:hypothetical protein
VRVTECFEAAAAAAKIRTTPTRVHNFSPKLKSVRGHFLPQEALAVTPLGTGSR